MTAAMRPQVSDSIRWLAALVRAPLTGEAPPAVAVDRDFVEFAIRRHRVGPLLYVAQAAWNSESAHAKLLAVHYLDNARRFASSELFLKDLADKFCTEKIPWLTFKGVTLARQLYPEPNWRQVNDVDVLVPPDRFGDALQMMRRSGLSIIHTRRDPDFWVEKCMARLAKDVMLRDERLGLNVELHRRLFFARAEENQAVLLRNAFSPHLSPAGSDMPSPPVGAALALYLLLHGANSRWFRMKWLVDLLAILARMGEVDVHAIADTADQLRATVSVKAGLRIFAWVFGDAALGPAASWLNETAGRDKIEARARIFLHALEQLDATGPAREGDRLDSLDVYYAIAESVSYRSAALLRGGAWIALRALCKILP